MSINEILASIVLLTLMASMIDIAYNYKKIFKD